MTYEDSIRILLAGTTGINKLALQRGSGVGRPALYKFLRGEPLEPRTLDKIARFVFRQINANILLAPEDLAPSGVDAL